jgi:hypothetical protein
LKEKELKYREEEKENIEDENKKARKEDRLDDIK